MNAIESITSGSVHQILDKITGSYIVTSAVTDMEINSVWWIVRASVKPGQYCELEATILENPKITYKNTYANGRWFGWALLAIAEPPQEFDLLLASGVVACNSKCTYWKNDFNECHAVFYCVKSGTANDITDDDMFTLPSGYRPSNTVSVSIAGITQEYMMVVGTISIEVSGNIHAWFSTPVMRTFGSMVFIATK